MVYITYLSLLTVLLASTTTTGLAAKNDPPCPPGVRVFVSPGAEALPGQLTHLHDPIHRILEAIPGSTYVRVPYRHSPGGLRTELTPGQLILEDLLKEFVGFCPQTPIVLYGYSEGAMITTNTLCGASSERVETTPPVRPKLTRNLIAAVVMGDETRTPDQPYNFGSCTAAGTMARQDPSSCSTYASVIRSYCDAPDPLCCVGGNNFTAHAVYAENYAVEATKFIVDQYNAFRSQVKEGT